MEEKRAADKRVQRGKHGRRTRMGDDTGGEDGQFIRPENEDDDGYDPFSDRPPQQEPLFERDPWN